MAPETHMQNVVYMPVYILLPLLTINAHVIEVEQCESF